MTREGRVRGIVVQVVGEALRGRGLRGVITGAPPSPETALLERWLAPAFPMRAADPGAVTRVTEALEGDDEAAWDAWATALGRREGLLVLHPGHKSILLLDGPLAPCFPLGDLWGYQVREWAGAAARPTVLRGLPQEEADAVEEGLRRGLEEGVGVERGLAGVDPGVARRVRDALGAGRRLARPPLVPKLTSWTVGVDPAP